MRRGEDAVFGNGRVDGSKSGDRMHDGDNRAWGGWTVGEYFRRGGWALLGVTWQEPRELGRGWRVIAGRFRGEEGSTAGTELSIYLWLSWHYRPWEFQGRAAARPCLKNSYLVGGPDFRRAQESGVIQEHASSPTVNPAPVSGPGCCGAPRSFRPSQKKVSRRGTQVTEENAEEAFWTMIVCSCS